MTESEYDFWRGWRVALDQHGAYLPYHWANQEDADFADGYISACQYHDMPVVKAFEEVQSVSLTV